MDMVSNALTSNTYARPAVRCSLSTYHVYSTLGKAIPASAFKLTEWKGQSCWSHFKSGLTVPWHALPLTGGPNSAVTRFNAPGVLSLVTPVTSLPLLLNETPSRVSSSISSPSLGNDGPSKVICSVSGATSAVCVAVQAMSWNMESDSFVDSQTMSQSAHLCGLMLKWYGMIVR